MLPVLPTSCLTQEQLYRLVMVSPAPHLRISTQIIPAGSSAHSVVEAASKFALSAFGSSSARSPASLRSALLCLLKAAHGKLQCPSLMLSMVRLATVARMGTTEDGFGSLPALGGAGAGSVGVAPDDFSVLRCLLVAGLSKEDVLSLPVRVGLQRPDLAPMQAAMARLVTCTASTMTLDAVGVLDLCRELSSAFITRLLGPLVGAGVGAASGDCRTLMGHVVVGHLCRGGMLGGSEAHTLALGIVRPDWYDRPEMASQVLEALRVVSMQRLNVNSFFNWNLERLSASFLLVWGLCRCVLRVRGRCFGWMGGWGCTYGEVCALVDDDCHGERGSSFRLPPSPTRQGGICGQVWQSLAMLRMGGLQPLVLRQADWLSAAAAFVSQWRLSRSGGASNKAY
jgi:hypothetical protein